MLRRRRPTAPARRTGTGPATGDTAAPQPGDSGENMASIPDRWCMAVRSPSLGGPGGREFCEWQLIAIHERETTPMKFGMFWWHTTKRETETALAEIGPLLSRGMAHEDRTAGYIADLYERYGMRYGPARTTMTIDNMGGGRSIPDADPQHFQRAIDMLPDPELDAKNRKLDTEHETYEAAFNLTVGIDESDGRTGIATYSTPDSGTTTTVRTQAAAATRAAAGKETDAGETEREEELIGTLARELLRAHVPRRTVENAVEAWRGGGRTGTDEVE